MKNDICGIDFKRRPGRKADGALSRGATFDGSRGFEPTESRVRLDFRRGATGELGVWMAMRFKRRSVTRGVGLIANRGLKPTATIMGSLRDRVARVASLDGSRVFQHPENPTRDDARRVAGVELADLNQEAAALAKKIQKNFEELGV